MAILKNVKFWVISVFILISFISLILSIVAIASTVYSIEEYPNKVSVYKATFSQLLEQFNITGLVNVAWVRYVTFIPMLFSIIVLPISVWEIFKLFKGKSLSMSNFRAIIVLSIFALIMSAVSMAFNNNLNDIDFLKDNVIL